MTTWGSNKGGLNQRGFNERFENLNNIFKEDFKPHFKFTLKLNPKLFRIRFKEGDVKRI